MPTGLGFGFGTPFIYYLNAAAGGQFYRSVVVDHTLVAEAVSGFPILVSFTADSLKSVGNGGNVQNANGYDIRFYVDTGLVTPLFWEMERYNASTGEVVAWVKNDIDDISDVAFYMVYGDSSISSFQSTVADVWSNSFVGVWHFLDGTTLSASDSANGHNGTLVNTPTATSGKIDGAASFTAASSSHISIPTFNPGNNITVASWIKTSASGTNMSFCSKDDSIVPTSRSWQFRKNTSNKGEFIVFNSNTNAATKSGLLNINNNEWRYLVGTFNSTIVSLYVDGVIDGSSVALSGNLNAGTNVVYVGRAETTDAIYYTGAMDELRISSTARSSGWISTEYNSMNDPSTFAVVGAEVPL